MSRTSSRRKNHRGRGHRLAGSAPVHAKAAAKNLVAFKREVAAGLAERRDCGNVVRRVQGASIMVGAYAAHRRHGGKGRTSRPLAFAPFRQLAALRRHAEAVCAVEKRP